MASTQEQPQFLEHACVATRMLNKRRQLFDVKEILIARKAEYDKKMEEFKLQEEELGKKDLQFQQSLVKFRLFSKENEIRQQRAAKRVVEEQKLCISLGQSLEEKHAELEEKRLEGRRLAQLVEKKKKYSDYIASSADYLHLGPNKLSSEDIIDRFELLKQTSERTKERLEALDQEITRQRAQYDRLLVEKNCNILEGNNEVSPLQTQRNETASLQSTLDEHVQNNSTSSDLDQVHLAIFNIVERFENLSHDEKNVNDTQASALRRRGPAANHTEENATSKESSKAFLEAMESIAEYIEDYGNIVKDWESR